MLWICWIAQEPRTRCAVALSMPFCSCFCVSQSLRAESGGARIEVHREEFVLARHLAPEGSHPDLAHGASRGIGGATARRSPRRGRANMRTSHPPNVSAWVAPVRGLRQAGCAHGSRSLLRGALGYAWVAHFVGSRELGFHPARLVPDALRSGAPDNRVEDCARFFEISALNQRLS